MRRPIFTLIAFALLLTFFVSCTDHRSSGVTPTGRRFQLRSLNTYDSSARQQYNREFAYTPAGLLSSVRSAYLSSSGEPTFSYWQYHTYNSSDQMVKYTRLSATTGWGGIGIEKLYTYGSDGRVIEIKTYNVIRNNAVPHTERLAQIDSLRYDGQGRVSRVDISYYVIDSNVSGPSTDSKSTTTIEYDGKGNPARVTFIQSPHPGSQQWTRTRLIYEYDDHINPLANVTLIDSPIGGFYNLMKNNPVRARSYSLGENLVETGLSTETTYTYEYQDGLPVKMTQNSTSAGTPIPQPVRAYTYLYNFL